MDFERSGAKARANLHKHGVDFAGAATVFENDSAPTIPGPSAGEKRYLTLASDALGRMLVVAYTWRGERFRINSARKASSAERQAYGDRR